MICRLRKLIAAPFLILLSTLPLFAMSGSDIASYQKEIADRPIGERIALWAERYVGTPYDPDPLGEYVTKKVIVADERVDCMYLSFRTVELATGHTPEEAIQIALDKRFIDRGILKGDVVINYDDRFQYGEDMLDSRKWGREITGDVGPVTFVKGSRGRGQVEMVSKEAVIKIFEEQGKPPLKSGDFIFFIKSPEKRMADEIIGHIGIIKLEGNALYLIHASGRKNRKASEGSMSFWGDGGGEVKKMLFYDYVSSMPFVGVRVSRFN